MRRYFSDVSWLAVPKRPGRALIEHPQMMGIAPSFWFWTRRDVIVRASLVALPFGALAGMTRFLAGGTGLETALFTVLGALWGLGIVERGIRTVLHRRAALAERRTVAAISEVRGE